MKLADLERDMRDVIPTGSSIDSEFLYARMSAATLDATGAGAGARVLDAAAGLGQDSRALAQRGARTVCAEPSRRMSELGRHIEQTENGATTLWTQAWSEALPFADDSFDATFCKGALDHFDDPSACIAEMARVTRRRGRVVLAVANFDSLATRLQQLADRLRPTPRTGRQKFHVPSDHYTRYDLDLLRQQAAEHLHITAVEGASLLWGLRPWTHLLNRLPAAHAQATLQRADRYARRHPHHADVLILTGHPRKQGGNRGDVPSA